MSYVIAEKGRCARLNKIISLPRLAEFPDIRLSCTFDWHDHIIPQNRKPGAEFTILSWQSKLQDSRTSVIFASLGSDIYLISIAPAISGLALLSPRQGSPGIGAASLKLHEDS